ncbi:LAFA_0F01464g1_1 [Lachancea sp. 'fantastica']|nr:LAFA_0F01464g1_1 [Lachancea sp. 'fantastica']
MVKLLPLGFCIATCIFGALVASSPVTFELLTGEQECLYVETLENSVISYYFAVQHSWSGISEIYYDIYGPGIDENPIFASSRETQGEWSFVARSAGEYRFCFRASESSCMVDVEILVNSDNSLSKPNNAFRPSSPVEFEDPLQDTWERSLELIERQLKVLETNMDRYKTRTMRNSATVLSIASRANMLAVCGSLVIMGVIYCQTKLLKRLRKSIRSSNRKR